MSNPTAVLPEAPWYSKQIYKNVVHWGEVEWFKAISSRYAIKEWLEDGLREEQMSASAQRVLTGFFEHLAQDPIFAQGYFYAEPARWNAAWDLGAKVVYDVDSASIEYFADKPGFDGLMIDVFAPDSLILSAVSDWLAEKRKAHDFRPSVVTAADMRQWLDASAIEYVDLDLWFRFKGISVSSSKIADALFPNQSIDRVEKLRKVTRRHAKTILSVNTYRGLSAQQVRASRKEIS